MDTSIRLYNANSDLRSAFDAERNSSSTAPLPADEDGRAEAVHIDTAHEAGEEEGVVSLASTGVIDLAPTGVIDHVPAGAINRAATGGINRAPTEERVDVADFEAIFL